MLAASACWEQGAGGERRPRVTRLGEGASLCGSLLPLPQPALMARDLRGRRHVPWLAEALGLSPCHLLLGCGPLGSVQAFPSPLAPTTDTAQDPTLLSRWYPVSFVKGPPPFGQTPCGPRCMAWEWSMGWLSAPADPKPSNPGQGNIFVNALQPWLGLLA